jgi:Xaa-Pro aminopeptidase
MKSLRQSAYLSIVGSGPTCAYLHYSTNERQIKDGDLVLLDAGGEYLGYAADITRMKILSNQQHNTTTSFHSHL